MTITNKSKVTLLIANESLVPGATKRYKTNNGQLVIKSREGCCKIIVTEEGKFKFQNEGKIKAQFGMRKDRTGIKVVNIVSVN